MREPYVQYIQYGTVFTGVGVLINRLNRSRAMAKYAEAKIAHAPEEQLLYWADMANVAPHQLERSARQIAGFRAQGILAAIGVPLLWATWQVSRNRQPPKKNR